MSIRSFIWGVVLTFTLPLFAGETKLGKPISVDKPTSINDLVSHPDAYVGKEVRIEGEITEVCQMMGCWMNVKDASSKDTIQVKVEDGELVFPKNSAGKSVVAQGRLEKLALGKDQYIALLQHEAEESGKKIDTSKITQGKTLYRIKGSGAVIKD